jgi:hypothetical protein
MNRLALAARVLALLPHRYGSRQASPMVKDLTTMNSSPQKYPLLQELLTLKGRQLQATYTIRELAQIFNVSARAIQTRVASGQIASRDLPGRAKFLSEDLEAFLSSSLKKDRRHGK